MDVLNKISLNGKPHWYHVRESTFNVAHFSVTHVSVTHISVTHVSVAHCNCAHRNGLGPSKSEASDVLTK